MEEYRKTHERLVRVFDKEIVFIIGAVICLIAAAVILFGPRAA